MLELGFFISAKRWGGPLSTLGAVVVAAGKGTRMGTRESKQFLRIGGKPVLVHTLEVLEQAALVSEVILVVGALDIEQCEIYKSDYQLGKIKKIVAGGGERQHSVYAGLLQCEAQWVLVQDGVRPFLTSDMIERCYMAAMQVGGAAAAVPVKDTIKIADKHGLVTATPERSTLWSVQTPQTFRRDQLIAAHESAFKDGFIGTDDASLAERYGIPVQLVQGDYSNIKITTPEDLLWSEYRLRGYTGK
jgi:2-C-methyl-D-erythritol 4-phosphate cytidylyltransferase